MTKEDKPPHKAATAYSLFVREQYVATPKVNNRDEFMARSKEIAAQWNQLSDEAKKVRILLPSVPLSPPLTAAARAHVLQPYFDKEKELRAEFRAKLVAWFEKTDPRIISAYNKQRKAAHKQKVYAPADIRPSKPLPSFIQYVRLFSSHSRALPSFSARTSDARLTVMQSFSGLLAILGTRSSTAPTFPTRRRCPSMRGLSPRSGRRSLRRSRRYVSRPLMVLICVFQS